MEYRRSFHRLALIVFVAKAALLAVFLMGLPASGQTDDRAAKILASCEQAMGSQKAHRGFVGEGEVRYPDSAPTEHLLWKTKGPELSRLEFSGTDTKTIHVVSHGSGFREKDSKKETLPFHHSAYYRNEMVPALACSKSGWRPGMLAEYIGTEMVRDHSVSHLLFHMSAKGKSKHQDAVEELLSEYHVFVDNATNRVVSIRTWVLSPETVENRSLWEALYSDYRDVDGVLMPFRIQDRVAGQPYRETVLTSVQTDANISEADF